MYSFFAFLNRMKNIKRWNLMRCMDNENVAEHSLQTAMIAHSLAVINNKVFGGSIDAQKTALLALYHDAGEVITGDLITPIKYFDEKIKDAFTNIEGIAERRIVEMLPKELQEEMGFYIHADQTSSEYQLVKASDKISALTKCIEELKSGNTEFLVAKQSTERIIREMNLPEVNYFLENFIPAFEKTLDEL